MCHNCPELTVVAQINLMLPDPIGKKDHIFQDAPRCRYGVAYGIKDIRPEDSSGRRWRIIGRKLDRTINQLPEEFALRYAALRELEEGHGFEGGIGGRMMLHLTFTLLEPGMPRPEVLDVRELSS